MKSSEDFSPIAEQGELELEAGFLYRLKRRREIAPIAPGFTRVLLDAGGSPIDEVTAGQKYWSRARGWVKVDVRDKSLEYEIPFPDPSGIAGFVAVIDVTASVVNPQGAISAGAESVENIFRPVLQNAVRKAHRNSAVDESRDPVAILNDLRLAAGENVEALVGPVEGLPEWLAARVTAVSVDFDEATSKHREDLVRRKRAAVLADADTESEAAQARGRVKVQRIWEEGFANRLADPERRALARIATDPSPENVDRVAAQFDAIEADGRTAMVGFFQVALEKGYFPEEKSILEALQSMQTQLGERAILSQGAETKSVEPPDDQEQVVDAETVETDVHDLEPNRAEAEGEGADDGDKNWGR